MPSPGSCSRCNRALPADSDGELCPSCRGAAAPAGATVASGRSAAPPPRRPYPAWQPVPAAGDSGATRSPPAGTDNDDFFPDPREYLPEAPPGYDLLCQLGAGGVGTVYLAREHATERAVAMKFLNCPTSPTAFERFLVEARALARLDHPNIVKVIAVETNWREPFLTMEYAAGGTLADLAPPTPAEAARLVLGAAEAVAAAHAAGILHRDIKPSNILLQTSGSEAPAGPDATPSDTTTLTPKVSDFGLAKRTDRDDGLTRTGPLGTPSYMSPEAAAGRHRDIGQTADVYGLGATLYHLLTGRAPFTGDGRDEILRKVLREPPVRPRALRPDVPADLEGVVVKCLEKDPARRYPTATALAADLRRFLAGQAPDAPVLSPTRRARRWFGRQRRWIGAGVAAVVIAAALVAAGMGLRPRPADPEDVIRSEIAAGKKVRLLGPDGRPRAAAWPLGPEVPTLSSDDDGTCSFGSWTPRILVLLTDPGVDRYRIEAEIWQAEKLRDVLRGNNDDHNEVGLVLGYAGQDGANRTRVHTFMVLKFTDFDPADGPKVRRHVQFMDAAIVSPAGLAPSKPQRVRGPTTRLPPPGPRWRQLVVEVTPDGVQMSGPNGQPQLADDAAGIAARRKGPRQNGYLQEYVAPTAGEIVVPDWSPRVPLGIWCNQSLVHVRNVTIQALN